MCVDGVQPGILTHMVLMAVTGVAVLALVCWAMINETPPSFPSLIPRATPDHRAGVVATEPAGEGEEDASTPPDETDREQADHPDDRATAFRTADAEVPPDRLR
jgi:hypothetical protein